MFPNVFLLVFITFQEKYFQNKVFLQNILIQFPSVNVQNCRLAAKVGTEFVSNADAIIGLAQQYGEIVNQQPGQMHKIKPRSVDLASEEATGQQIQLPSNPDAPMDFSKLQEKSQLVKTLADKGIGAIKV